ncbi:hypothetical protein COOONC_28506 [Cooperia oncophora]
MDTSIGSPPFEAPPQLQKATMDQNPVPMISPQTIIKPTAQIKLEDQSMEVDSSRKTSTDRPLLTSIQHKPYQGKKHQNIATKKASVMAQKRLVLRFQSDVERAPMDGRLFIIDWYRSLFN